MPPRPPVCRRCNQVGHMQNMCTVQLATDSDALPPPASPIPPHTIPFVDTHMHCDYLCDTARVPNFRSFLERAGPRMPPTCVGCITTLCDATAILSDSLSQRQDLAENHAPGTAVPGVFFAIGLHPHNARYMSDRIVNKIAELMTDGKYPIVSHGEIGLEITRCKQEVKKQGNGRGGSGGGGRGDDLKPATAAAAAAASGPSVGSLPKGGSGLDVQVSVFLQQVQFARAIAPHLPVQLHIRYDEDEDAETVMSLLPWDDLLALPGVHFHCWMDRSVERMKAILTRFEKAPGNVVFGFTGGICGPAHSRTVEKVNDDDQQKGPTETTVWEYTCIKSMQQVIEFVPLGNFVLETDSPYMVPLSVKPISTPVGGISLVPSPQAEKVNRRGPPQFSHPGHIPYIAAAIASVKRISVDEVLRHALANSLRIYKLKNLSLSREVVRVIEPLIAAPVPRFNFGAAAPAASNAASRAEIARQQQQQPAAVAASSSSSAAQNVSVDVPAEPEHGNGKKNNSKKNRGRRGGAGGAARQPEQEAGNNMGNKFPSLGDFYQ